MSAALLRFAMTPTPARFAMRAARACIAVPGQQPVDGAVVVVADGRIEAVRRAVDFALDVLPVTDLGDEGSSRPAATADALGHGARLGG
jgi:hypothetical protein